MSRCGSDQSIVPWIRDFERCIFLYSFDVKSFSFFYSPFCCYLTLFMFHANSVWCFFPGKKLWNLCLSLNTWHWIYFIDSFIITFCALITIMFLDKAELLIRFKILFKMCFFIVVFLLSKALSSKRETTRLPLMLTLMPFAWTAKCQRILFIMITSLKRFNHQWLLTVLTEIWILNGRQLIVVCWVLLLELQTSQIFIWYCNNYLNPVDCWIIVYYKYRRILSL